MLKPGWPDGNAINTDLIGRKCFIWSQTCAEKRSSVFLRGFSIYHRRWFKRRAHFRVVGGGLWRLADNKNNRHVTKLLWRQQHFCGFYFSLQLIAAIWDQPKVDRLGTSCLHVEPQTDASEFKPEGFGGILGCELWKENSGEIFSFQRSTRQTRPLSLP